MSVAMANSETGSRIEAGEWGQVMKALETSRLLLTPLAEEHIDALHELSVDPDVRRYLFKDQVIPRAQVEQMVVDSDACFNALGCGFYAVFLNNADHAMHGHFTGFCGLRRFAGGLDMGGDHTELLIGVTPRIWGRGFGAEAARAVLVQAFENCSIDHVVAAADTPNQRSIRMLQKLGMSFRERREWHGWDTMFYQIAAEDFVARS